MTRQKSTDKPTKLYVFDLDGTLADVGHRIHHICNSDGTPMTQKDWDSFFASVIDDEPIHSTIDILKALVIKHEVENDPCKILILTARNDSTREQTSKWLEKHLIVTIDGKSFFPGCFVKMRPTDNREQDDVLKPKLLEVFLADTKSSGINYEVVCIFEDRTRVVNAWRNLGYQCYQVQSGDF